MAPLARLAATWDFASGFAARAIDGLSADEWRRRAGDGNPPRWIVGHLAVSRRGALRLAGVAVPRDPWEAAFQRGSLPDDAAEPDGPTLHADFVAQGARLAALLPTLDEAQVAAKAARAMPDGSDTLAGVLHFLHFHESYHLGQLGLIRRLLGKARIA